MGDNQSLPHPETGPARPGSGPAPVPRIPLPRCRYALRKLERYTLKIYTLGHYSRESDATADREWFAEHESESVWFISGG